MNIAPRNKLKTGGGLTAISAVVLVMLVFFLIMTVMDKKPDTAEKPVEKAFAPAVTVVITKDNQYYLLPGESDKDKRGFDDVKQQIIERIQGSDSRQLKIEGAQLAKYETIYNVAGLAQINNWEYRLDFIPETGE